MQDVYERPTIDSLRFIEGIKTFPVDRNNWITEQIIVVFWETEIDKDPYLMNNYVETVSETWGFRKPDSLLLRTTILREYMSC